MKMQESNLIKSKLSSRLIWTVVISYAFTLEKANAMLPMLSRSLHKFAKTNHLAQYCQN